MNYKLYVWEGFEPDYTDGLAVAIASTEEEARELILKEAEEVYEWGELTIKPLKPYGCCVRGGG